MKPHVLFVVLDWGLGHASRSSFVIDQLLQEDVELTLASAGAAFDFLSLKYPTSLILRLPEEEVRYNKEGARSAIIRRVFRQTKINKIQHKWTEQVVAKLGISHMISDNVYGAYSRIIPSILISHQLSLKSPLFEKIFQRKLASWINQFNQVWIPDFPGPNSIAGQLAENPLIDIPQRHMGIISQFKKGVDAEPKIDCTVLLSGVEPQRSILEKKLVRIMPKDISLALVRGTVLKTEHSYPKGVEVFDLIEGAKLNDILDRSSYVICRSGYSSLMDVIALEKPATVIPTPQQPEQNYLGKRVNQKGWIKMIRQDEIKSSIFSPYPDFTPPVLPENDSLAEIIHEFLKHGSR